MKLEGVMLNEISQTETNTVWSHLHVASRRKKQTQAHADQLEVARGRGWEEGEMGQGGPVIK